MVRRPARASQRDVARLVMLRLAGSLLRRPRPRVSVPESPKVLLIRPDHLGDLVLSTPAVELLRRGLPGAHLTMMVGPWSAEVARRDPMLDEVLVCPFPGFTREPKGSSLAPYDLLWRWSRIVRRGRYDAALLLRFDHWWGAWLAALAGIPVRIGHAVPECRPFLTHALRPPDGLHWVERSLEAARRLLAVAGVDPEGDGSLIGLRFGILQEDRESAERLLSQLDLEMDQPLVAIHPGAGAPIKIWPEDRWIELGWSLAARGARLLVTGSALERPMAERIAAALPNGRALAGKTDLGTLAAIFRRCALVVGTDNGPLHVAVAMGVPTVHLFGPTDPAVFGPWGDPAAHRVVSAPWVEPCGRLDLPKPEARYAPCMEAISAEKVVAECMGLLSSR